MKVCSKCSQEKSDEDFFKDKRGRNGRRSTCKTCDTNTKGRKITPPHLRKRATINGLPADGVTLAEKRRRIDDIKVTQPCACCGQYHTPKCMDFHHLDESTKSFSLSQIKRFKTNEITWKDIENEIAKCILVCATCHRKIHEGVVQLLGV